MSARDLFEASLSDPVTRNFPAVIVAELLAITDIGSTVNEEAPCFVVYAKELGEDALKARSIVDLFAIHIGSKVVLSFENGDPTLPIIMGVINSPHGVEVEADGTRMLVTAKEQITLRCGKASITLTKAGKVLIQGAYVSSRSTGVNRIKGGSVQLN
jgi:Domain of unknown function (DUF6484)